MRCPKCSAEWHLPANMPTQIKSCPFCGESLLVEPVEGLKTIDAVLLEIVRRFGMDILRHSSKTIAIFSDLAPQMRREKLLLTYLMQCNGNIRLLEVKNLTQSEQRATYLKVVQHLTNEQFVAQAAAENVCLCFLKAIGVCIPSEQVFSPRHIAEPSSNRKQMPSISNTRLPPKRIVVPSTINQVTSMSNFEDYMKALEQRYIDNGKHMLTTMQIKDFLSSNGLDKTLGIQISDVETDLKTISEKYRYYQYLVNVLHQKEVQGKTGLRDLLQRYASRR